MSVPYLRVRREDLVEAIKQVGLAMSPDTRELELRIEFNGTFMQLTAAGVKTEIIARGELGGFARVPLRTLKAVGPLLPQNDPLTLKFKYGRFYIERWSVPGEWQHIAPAPLDMPLQPTDRDLLEANEKKPFAKIMSSGLRRAVTAAEKEAQRRLATAARALKPYGVTEADLEELMKSKLGK